MNERDHIHKVAIKQNNPSTWDEYKVLRNRVTHMLNKCKAEYYHGLIRESAHNSKK